MLAKHTAADLPIDRLLHVPAETKVLRRRRCCWHERAIRAKTASRSSATTPSPPKIWSGLLAAEEDRAGLEPTGLGARDVLRLGSRHAALRLRDRREPSRPIAGGQTVGRQAGEGRRSPAATRSSPRSNATISTASSVIVMDGRVPARHGYRRLRQRASASARSAAPRSLRRTAGRRVATALVHASRPPMSGPCSTSKCAEPITAPASSNCPSTSAP